MLLVKQNKANERLAYRGESDEEEKGSPRQLAQQGEAAENRAERARVRERREGERAGNREEGAGNSEEGARNQEEGVGNRGQRAGDRGEGVGERVVRAETPEEREATRAEGVERAGSQERRAGNREVRMEEGWDGDQAEGQGQYPEGGYWSLGGERDSGAEFTLSEEERMEEEMASKYRNREDSDQSVSYC